MKKSKILKDTILSFSALILFNLIIQFILYPFLEHQLGTNGYGNFIYMITFINIFSAAIGSGLGLERIKLSVNSKTFNGDFLILFTFSILPVTLIAYIYLYAGKIQLSITEFLIYILLCLFTIFRNYADSDFRLSLKYTHYFYYYLVLIIGYLFGLAIWGSTTKWMYIFLFGEIFAFIFVAIKGTVLNKKPFQCSSQLKLTISSTLPLIFSALLNNCIFNMDRIILKISYGSEAVSIYYIAGLFGKTMSLVSLPLNNIAIGYLAKYKKKFTVKTLNQFLIISLILGTLAEIGCSLGSYIILPWLYPTSSVLASSYYIIANLGSVIFFTTSFLTIILLRYGKEKYQLYANLVYAAAFFIFCVPACIYYNIQGLCISLIFVNILRLIVVYFLCIKSLKYP